MKVTFRPFILVALLLAYVAGWGQIRDDGTTQKVPPNKSKSTSQKIKKKSSGDRTAKSTAPRTEGPRNEGALQKINRNVEKNRSKDLTRHASGEQVKTNQTRSSGPQNSAVYRKTDNSGNKSKELSKGSTGDRSPQPVRSQGPRNSVAYRADRGKGQRKSQEISRRESGDRKIQAARSQGPQNASAYRRTDHSSDKSK
jgi:hypothetical protein